MIDIKADGGVRYTVPQSLDVTNMNDKVVVRFRVGDVFKNRSVCVYYGDEKVQNIKKRVMAPGEMEQVVLMKSSFDQYENVESIRICTEEN